MTGAGRSHAIGAIQLRVVPSRWRATVVDDLGIPRLHAGAQQDPASVMALRPRQGRVAD